MKKAIIFLLFSIIVIAIIPIFLPKTIHQEVEYIYDAKPNKVYNYFNDLKKMSLWFSWNNKSTSITQKFSTPAQGVGAEYLWAKEGEPLQNKVEITDNKDLQFVGYKLKFNNYDGNTSEAIFQVLDDDKVKVIWTFDSAELSYPYQIYNFIMKYKVKEHLERGLKKLDEILQKEENTEEEESVILSNQAGKSLFGIVQTVAPNDNEEYNIAIEEGIGMVESYLLDEKELTPLRIGNAIIYTIKKDTKEHSFISGFFIDKAISAGEGMETIKVPANKTLSLECDNTEKAIRKALNRIKVYAEENNLHLTENYWKEFLDTGKIKVVFPITNK